MECVEAKALKTSFWPEMGLGLKSSSTQQQVVLEDIWVGNGTCVTGDETFVDDFLDFSNEDVETEQRVVVEEEEEEDEEEKVNLVCSSNGVLGKSDFGDVFQSELIVPTEDVAADLEWLSHFVEDSFSEFSLQHVNEENPNPSLKTENPDQNRSEPEKPLTTAPTRSPCLETVVFPSQVPAKARSKRLRTGGRVWSLGSSSVTEISSSSSSSSNSSSSSSSSSCLIFNSHSGTQTFDYFDSMMRPPMMKKHKKKNHHQQQQERSFIAEIQQQQQQRQRCCSHCGVQKTPQWRTGPSGAKTLCNACGVRYKSGRLLPEYRPALSPTFVSEVHSNNHRKVLEMRKKKETGRPETGFAPAVHSF